MVTILCIFVCAAALLSALVFGGDVGLSLLAAGIAAGLAVLDRLLGRKLAWAKALGVLLGVGLLVFCFYIPSRTADYGYEDYLQKTEDYMGALLREDGEEAEALRQEIAEKYGESDDLRYLAANAAIAAGDLDRAEHFAYSFTDRHSKAYYLLWEEIILDRDMDNDAKLSRLRDLYVNAARDNPEWVYALQCAGGMLFDEGKYSQAAYYLVNALTYAEAADAETLYFLGACLMEQSEYQKGLYYFRLSADAGAGPELLKSIAWYAKKAGIEVEWK